MNAANNMQIIIRQIMEQHYEICLALVSICDWESCKFELDAAYDAAKKFIEDYEKDPANLRGGKDGES